MASDFDLLKEKHQRLWRIHEERTVPAEEIQAFLDDVATYIRASGSGASEGAAERTSDQGRLYGWVQFWGEYLRGQGHSAMNSMAGWMWSGVRFLGVDPVRAVHEEPEECAATLELASGAAIRVPFLAPARPESLVAPRQELLDRLAERLTANSTLVLYGKTGVGKSLLATSLIYHLRVLTHFNDGVLYAVLGKRSDERDTSDIYEALGAWCKTLGLTDAEVAGLTDIEQRRRALKERMGTRRMLLAVDDVWYAADADLLRCGGPNAGYLLTVYDRELAERFVGPGGALGREIELVQPLGREENRLLFGEMLQRHGVKASPAAVDGLAALPGISPLVLDLAAGAVRYTKQKEVAWWFEQLRSVAGQASAEAAEGPGAVAPTALGNAGAEDPLLEKMLTLLVETVSEAGRAALRALSMLPARPSHFSEAAAAAITGAARQVAELMRCGLLLTHSPSRLMMHAFVKNEMGKELDEKPDELARARKRMLEHFCRFIIDHRKQRSCLCIDHANIVEALNLRAEDEPDAEIRRAFVDAVNAHHAHLMAKGLYDLTRDNLRRSLKIAMELPYPKGECESEHHLGDVLEKCGDSAEAEEHLDRALGLGRHLGLPVLVCQVLERLAAVALQQGYYAQAEEFLQEGEEQGEKFIQQAEKEGAAAPEGALEAYCLILLRRGVLETNRQADALAAVYNQRGLNLAQKESLRELECAARLNQGVLFFYQGEYADAEAADQLALRLAREIPDREREGGILQALGGVAIATGEYLRAQRYLEESLDLARQLGHRWYEGIVQKEFGELYLKLRKPELATRAFRDAERIGLGTTADAGEAPRDPRLMLADTPDLVAFALYGQARTAAYLGNYAEAITLAGQSLRFAERIGHRLQFQVRDWLVQQREVEALISGR
jgi:tetratricopeptide (TPR) repeat protein